MSGKDKDSTNIYPVYSAGTTGDQKTLAVLLKHADTFGVLHLLDDWGCLRGYSTVLSEDHILSLGFHKL